MKFDKSSSAAVVVFLGILQLAALQGVVTNCKTPGHLAITFDDGPHPFITPQVLDLFNTYNLSTTFFVVGTGNWETNVTRYRDAIRRAYNEGHQIGSHTWSHANLVQNMTADEIRNELAQVANLVGGIIGRNMTIFRPPYGAYNDLVLQIAREEFGYEVVNWNIDTNDWAHPDDPDAGFEEYLDVIQSGNHTSYVALHHDWTDAAVELADRVIQYAESQNLTIVTVAECLGVQMYRDDDEYHNLTNN